MTQLKELKRHHLALWGKQYAKLDPQPELREFIREKLREKGIDPETPLRRGNQEFDVVKMLESEIRA